jgi:hypothetical protein
VIYLLVVNEGDADVGAEPSFCSLEHTVVSSKCHPQPTFPAKIQGGLSRPGARYQDTGLE